MKDTSFPGRGRFKRLGCGGVMAIAAIISSIAVMLTSVQQWSARPQGVHVPAGHISGDYLVQDVQGFNNTGGFSKMPLDQVEKNSVVTVLQDSHSVQLTYTDWKNTKRTDKITRIGQRGSKWVWTTNGLAGASLPVRIFNFFMLPGLVYYDQRGSLTQTSTGLLLDYTWAEGGALFWLLPWKDAPQRTVMVLTRDQKDK